MANYRALAAAAAAAYGLDPNIFLRQINQESGFNPNARSRAGALGIAQFMPATARGAGVNPLDPRSALYGAAKMDAQNLKKYGNWQDVLSLYNSGRGWSQGQQIGETRNYVASILGGKGGGAGAPLPPSLPGASSVAQGPSARQQLALDLISAIGAKRHGEKPNYLSIIQRFRQAEMAPSGSGPVGQGAPALPQGVPQGGASEMEQAIQMARRMGLSVGENPAVGQVHPVHVKGSYHYQDYPGTKIGRATDVSGDPQRMAAFFKWAAKTYGKGLTELFYDPLGAIKFGRPIAPVGGHGDHVHIAF